MTIRLAIPLFLLLILAPAVRAAETAAPPQDAAWEQARMDTLAGFVTDITPPGFTQTGPIARYTTANLYDKINGRSELYNSYDVVGLAFVSFALEGAPEKFIDIFLYDLRTPLGAFGAYSVERWSDSKPLELGQGGYRTDKDHFFWTAEYYANIFGVDDSAAVQEACVYLGKKLAGRLPKSEEIPWGMKLFAPEGLSTESIQYFSIDGLSLDFMVRTFSARYTQGGEEYQVFVSQSDDDKAAQAVRDQFAGYLKSYGSDVTERSVEGTQVICGDTGGGYHDGVFVQGRYVAGFSALKDLALVDTIVKRLQEKLKQP
ncbi:MAG: hypothetical protein HYV27_17130 [Candidatus Hydrogenedentes bacterium]|nr:hypothetical protein [Candidatus Hydrogenedentota bacterium]